MACAFVLGNGVSRQAVDLKQLRKCGRIYGCNALYREFQPNVLVATDTPISEEIQRSGYALHHNFYTRRPVEGRGARRIPEQYWKYSSGPAAAGLAAESGFGRIYLLGFDLGPTEHNLFNNVYAGTEFYRDHGAQPTYTGNWVNQLVEVFEKFPNTEFVRVIGTTSAKIDKFQTVPNLVHQDLADFLTQLNTG